MTSVKRSALYLAGVLVQTGQSFHALHQGPKSGRTSNEKSLNVCKNRKVVTRDLKHKHRTDTSFNIIYITRNIMFRDWPGCTPLLNQFHSSTADWESYRYAPICTDDYLLWSVCIERIVGMSSHIYRRVLSGNDDSVRLNVDPLYRMSIVLNIHAALKLRFHFIVRKLSTYPVAAADGNNLSTYSGNA